MPRFAIRGGSSPGSGSGETFPTSTIIAFGPFNANPFDRVRYNPTAGTFTINMPASPATDTQVGVKNVTDDLTLITVDGNGANVEDPQDGSLGATTSVRGSGASIVWEFDGTSWIMVYESYAVETSAGAGTDSEQFGIGAVASAANASAFGNAASALEVDATVVGSGATVAAAAVRSTAIGKSASVTAADGTVLGWFATDNGNSGVTALGRSANGTGIQATAVGVNATADQGGVAVGITAKATALNTIGIGLDSDASATRGVSVGAGSEASGVCSTAVGSAAVADATDAQAFGEGAQAREANATAVGKDATVQSIAVASIGSITTIAGSLLVDGQVFVLDDGANPAVTFEFDDDSSVVESGTLRQVVFSGATTADQLRDAIITAITGAPVLDIGAFDGGAATVSLINGTAGAAGNVTITETVVDNGFVVAGMSGGEDAASTAFGMAIGPTALVRNVDNSIAIGSAASALGGNQVTVVGVDASGSAEDATVYGFNASAAGARSTAIGANSSASLVNATAVGSGATADDVNCVAVGQNASVVNNGVAVGRTASTTGTSGVAVGAGAEGAGGAAAFGATATATGTSSTAVGAATVADATDASSFGRGANAGGVGATAMGRAANAAQDDAIAIGRNAATTGVGDGQWGAASNPVDFNMYGDANLPGRDSVNGQQLLIKSATTLLSALSGASVTAAGLIPAGSVVLGVTARVTTTITGATTFDIGDGTDVDRWGAGIALAAGTTSDNADWTAQGITNFAAANDVVLTANVSDFTAGAVRLTIHYIAPTAPTS